MRHTTRSQWATIAFVFTAVLGIGFAAVAFLAEGTLATKATWFTFVVGVALLVQAHHGRASLPWWRQDDAPLR